MEIYNVKSIEIINQENKELKKEKIAQTKIINDLILLNQKKDAFNMQLAKSLAELNLKVSKLEEQ